MNDELSPQISIDRKRAKFAYDCAKNGSRITKNKEYKAYVKKIPMLIKTNGIAATLAFIKSKSESDESKAGYAYKLIYQQITDWLKEQPIGIIPEELRERELEYAILNLNSNNYRAVTNEALAFLNWLKRFADGLIEDKGGK